jgi:hypothetical protein
LLLSRRRSKNLKTKSSIRLSRTTNRRKSTEPRDSSRKLLMISKSKSEIVVLTSIMKISIKFLVDQMEIKILLQRIRKRKS